MGFVVRRPAVLAFPGPFSHRRLGDLIVVRPRFIVCQLAEIYCLRLGLRERQARGRCLSSCQLGPLGVRHFDHAECEILAAEPGPAHGLLRKFCSRFDRIHFDRYRIIYNNYITIRIRYNRYLSSSRIHASIYNILIVCI